MSQRRLIGLLAAFLLLAAAAIFFLFDPAQNGWYPRCQFHRLTGLNCPGCGSLRALHHLTHGEIGAAFRCNPLLIGLLPLLAFVGVRWLRHGRKAFDTVLLRPVAVWTLLGATVAFGVLRNLPGPAFAWMSP